MNKKSIVKTHPELASEWHPTKNGKLTPKDVTYGCSKKAWWKCKNGHEWKAIIRSRTRPRLKQCGCPYCTNRKLCETNRLAIVYPELASEWHPIKNRNTKPYDVTYGSGKKAWWKCSNGHEWKDVICKRVKGNGCPYCSGHRACIDNCLAILHPKMATQWHPTKNGKLTPKDVTTHSSKKAWWKCKNGHEWKATIDHRTRGRGCPYCSNKKVYIGNCLSTTRPKIASEWHPTKNGKLTPNDVVGGSNKKAWWKCSRGHEWKTAISNRVSGQNCPYCNNKKVCIDNCLATTHPEIASQWHPTKNGNLTPEDFTYGVGRKIWWKCIKEHEWKATIASRATGNGCPCCSSYVLFNNEKYDSLIECYYALELHKKKINFIHNIMYPDLGKRKFDFYIPEKNEYIETTSFNSKYIRWIEYKKNIEFKKQYVENVLKAKFTFIQRDLTKEEIHYVRKNLKKDTQSKHPLFDF